MVAELIVSNPRRRRRKLSAKQIAAGFGGKRRKSSSTRRRRTRSSHRRRGSYRVTRVRRNPLPARSASPKRRRRSRSSSRRRAYVRRARSSVSRSFRGVTRGLGGIEKLLMSKIVPAGIGAAGALAVDLAWGYLPLPSALQSGMLAPVARIAGAFGIGALAGMVMGRKFGEEVMSGALVVTLYDLAKGYAMQYAPSLPWGGAAASSGTSGMGVYIPGGMGVYIPGGMGEYTPFYNNEVTNNYDPT